MDASDLQLLDAVHLTLLVHVQHELAAVATLRPVADCMERTVVLLQGSVADAEFVTATCQSLALHQTACCQTGQLQAVDEKRLAAQISLDQAPDLELVQSREKRRERAVHAAVQSQP